MTLCTSPDMVRPSSKIYAYIDRNKQGDGVYWDHRTKGSRAKAEQCRHNKGCWDVSKSRVQRIFDRVFPYSLSVDPLTHQGMAVEKSDGQYTHDGCIVECPTRPKPGKVYQRFVDSSISETHFSEYRVFYHWGIDFVFEKIKPKTDQWGWQGDDLIPHEAGVFTDGQQELIDAFCGEFGLDFGELDVLAEDGRMYIIDVNNIAGNGSNVLGDYPSLRSRYQQAVERLCD